MDHGWLVDIRAAVVVGRENRTYLVAFSDTSTWEWHILPHCEPSIINHARVTVSRMNNNKLLQNSNHRPSCYHRAMPQGIPFVYRLHNVHMTLYVGMHYTRSLYQPHPGNMKPEKTHSSVLVFWYPTKYFTVTAVKLSLQQSTTTNYDIIGGKMWNKAL